MTSGGQRDRFRGLRVTQCASGQGRGWPRGWCESPQGLVAQAEEFGLFLKDDRNTLKVLSRCVKQTLVISSPWANLWLTACCMADILRVAFMFLNC